MKTDRIGQPPRSSFFAKYWMVMTAVTASLVAYGGMVSVHLRYGTLTQGSTPNTLTWYGLAFIAYLGLLLWTEYHQGLSFKIIWGGAIIFRLLLLFTPPTLSTDVHRYIWDGYLANNGVSPYAYPIDSPALDYLDTPQRALTNHTWMASPYLPAAQYLFASLTGLFPPSPLPFQATMLILDLLNGIVLLKLLKLVRLPPYRVFIYLWNPLIVVEVAHSAHVDTWMLLLTLLALWLTFGSPPSKALRRYLAPIVLGLATLTKGLPILLVAILFWRWRWWQLILFGLVTIGLLVPPGLAAGWGVTGPLDGTGLFGALRIYSDQWNFNSGLFHWLEVTLLNKGVMEANHWAKITMGGLMGIVMLGLWLKARYLQTPRANLRLMAFPFVAYILLTTTVHPWYLMILLGFLPFLPPGPTESRWRWLAVAPWLYLSGALALSYLTYLDPLDLREFEWVRKTEWWPVWGLVVVWGVGKAKLQLESDE
jgi:alpha-1,6-mannosyltransferase